MKCVKQGLVAQTQEREGGRSLGRQDFSGYREATEIGRCCSVLLCGTIQRYKEVLVLEFWNRTLAFRSLAIFVCWPLHYNYNDHYYNFNLSLLLALSGFRWYYKPWSFIMFLSSLDTREDSNLASAILENPSRPLPHKTQVPASFSSSEFAELLFLSTYHNSKQSADMWWLDKTWLVMQKTMEKMRLPLWLDTLHSCYNR